MPELDAAASVADVLPGGADTSLVEDSPIDNSESIAQEQESGESVPSPENQDGGEQPDQRQPKEDEGDGRVLSPDLRSHLKQLKVVNPKLEKSIRGAFFALNSYKEIFPNGVQEAKQFKADLEAFGGVDGIKGFQEASGKLAEIDAKLEKGDPSVVDGITDVLPVEAYPAIAGKLLDVFGSKDAEGYQRMMSGIIANTIDQSGIPLYLERIADYIKFQKPEEAVSMLQQIGKWFGGFREIANKKPEAKPVDQNAEKFQQERQQLDQEKTKMFQDSVSTEVSTWSKSRVLSEAEQYLKGRKLNADQSEALELKALGKVRASLLKNPNFTASYSKFFNAKDKDGLMKFIKAETDKLLPTAVKDSFRLLFSDFSAKAQPKPNGDKPAPTTKPLNTDFVKVSGPPHPDQVDHAKTPFEWKMRSKAVLKDGRRVTWA